MRTKNFILLVGMFFCLQNSMAQNGAGLNTCIRDAAAFHQVNQSILTSILKVESSFRSNAVNRNSNGTLDVGIAQINSIHFKKLAKYNIAPVDLLDPCIGTYVAAWHLAKQIKAYGNTWFAVGAYHSANPYFNSRYQALIYNALIDLKVYTGSKLRVPPLNKAQTVIFNKNINGVNDDIVALNN